MSHLGIGIRYDVSLLTGASQKNLKGLTVFHTLEGQKSLVFY